MRYHIIKITLEIKKEPLKFNFLKFFKNCIYLLERKSTGGGGAEEEADSLLNKDRDVGLDSGTP